MRTLFHLLILSACTLALVSCNMANYPEKRGYVNDNAQILDFEAGLDLEDTLRAFNRTNHVSIYIATTLSLEGVDYIEYTDGLANYWDFSTGGPKILLMRAPLERKFRIHTNKLARAKLSDQAAQRIFEEHFKTPFLNDDPTTAFKQGVAAIIAEVGPVSGPGFPIETIEADYTWVWILIALVVIVVILVVISKNSNSNNSSSGFLFFSSSDSGGGSSSGGGGGDC